MRSRKTLFGLCVVGAAAIGLLILIRDHEQQPQQEIASLRAELAALRATLQQQPPPRPGAGTAPLPRPQVRGSSEDAPSGSRAAPDDPSAASPPHLTYEQSQALVLDAYAAESADSTWSAKATDKLSALLRSHLPAGSQLTSLECRSTMCQVKVTHRNAQAHDAFLMEGFRDWPGSIFVAGQSQDHDALAVTLIAAREGTEPPLGPR